MKRMVQHFDETKGPTQVWGCLPIPKIQQLHMTSWLVRSFTQIMPFDQPICFGSFLLNSNVNQLFNLAANKRKVLPSNKHFHNNDYSHKRLKCFCLSKPRTKIAARSGVDFSEELSTGISTNRVIKHRPMHVLIVSILYMCIDLLKSKWRNQWGGETNKEN